MEEKKNAAFRVGITIFLLLATLTLGEFFIGWIALGWAGPLWLIALIKAFLIVRDYMHLPRLFATEEEAH